MWGGQNQADREIWLSDDRNIAVAYMNREKCLEETKKSIKRSENIVANQENSVVSKHLPYMLV